MRYAACTWILGETPLPEIASNLARLGYDGVELLGDLERYKSGVVKSVLADYGLSVVSLTPMDVDLAHPDMAVWQRAVDYYLRLLDFAAEVGCPIIGCHGAEARVRAITTYEEEYARYVEAVRCVAEGAQRYGLYVAMETLNRYEAHFLHTAKQALEFVNEVGAFNVGILLDTYHMSIEEADLYTAVLTAGKQLFLVHVADSNREGVGHGHINFMRFMRALKAVKYDGAVVMECTAPGPDPFNPAKGLGWENTVYRYLAESINLLRSYESIIA